MFIYLLVFSAYQLTSGTSKNSCLKKNLCNTEEKVINLLRGWVTLSTVTFSTVIIIKKHYGI